MHDRRQWIGFFVGLSKRRTLVGPDVGVGVSSVGADEGIAVGTEVGTPEGAELGVLVGALDGA